MRPLIELRFVVERSASGTYSIEASLLEETPVPPFFLPTPPSGVQRLSEVRTRATARGGFDATTWRRLYEYPRFPTLFFFDNPPWTASKLLDPAIRDLVYQFTQSTVAMPWANHRLAVHTRDPVMLEFPWQVVLPHPGALQPVHDVAFIARIPRPTRWERPLRLPLTLHIDGGLEQASGVLDDFTRRALGEGTFHVRDARTPSVEGDLVHFVNRRRDQILPPLASPRAMPRLVILESNDGDPDLQLVTSLLESGTGAVLLVNGAPPHRQAFFQNFYRKLLHNHPLDQCAREALIQANLGLGFDIDVLLAATEEGEYGLMFTRAAAELRAQGGTGTPKSASLEAWLQPFSAPARPQESRIARSVNPSLERLRRSAETAVEQAHTKLASVSQLLFHEEVHDLASAVDAFQEMEQAAAGNTSLKRLATRSDEDVQSELTRLLNVWLSLPPDQAPIDTARPLRVGQSLSLHVKIATAALAKAFAATFPDAVLKEAFAREDKVSLDVCVFHDGGTARVPQPRGKLTLPRFGPSDEFTTSVQLEKPGQCRLRVGVYHRNTLLQSIVVEAEVLAAEEPLQAPAPGDGPAIRYALDYVASPDLLLLDEHAAPSLSLVTNRTQDGSLWLGVFSDGSSGHGGLRAGTLHSFAPDTLAQQTEQVRDALQQVQGTARYRYDGPLDASNRDERARQLAQLAIQGWRLYDTLFNSNPSLSDDDKDSFDEGLEEPGTISIARCSLAETSIPWAALYDRPLDIGGGTAPTVCPVFLDQLAAGKDLLDEPAKCHELPTCPLKGEAARNTVCPFGFWGIRHQLEQPLKQLSAENEQQVAEELTSPAFVESCRVPASEGTPPALMGYGTNIPTGSEHLQELQQLSGWKLEASAERAKVLTTLEQGPANLLYIFCHGVVQSGVFKLQLPPQFIEAADLNRKKGRQPFLVFLNACESMATLPEVTNSLLGKLSRLGALAVIGSEIKINNLFARPFATRVLGDFLQGRSLGEAFLGARRHFLRSLNPLGLAYTLNAPVNVHLHAATCPRCPPPP